MKNKLKILQVNASNKYGGVSSFQYNYYKNIKNKNIEFTFLSPKKTSFEIKKEEIITNKDYVYELNAKGKDIIFLLYVYFRFKKFLKDKKYDIIHINSGAVFYNAVVAYIAKKHGKGKVIVHSHSSIKFKGLKKIAADIAKNVIKKYADYYFACSDVAAESMFPKSVIQSKKYVLINNAIDIDKYKFNEEERKKIRKNLKISDNCIVIGNVARLTKVKNHKYMIEMVEKLSKDNNNIKLLLIGDGELKEELKEQVKAKKLDNKVIFLGMKEDVYKYYSAFDIFILPSFYEGLPLSAVEAQSNGAMCIFSSNVSKETELTKLVKFIDIDEESIEDWNNTILSFNKKELSNREEYCDEVRKKGYDIKIESKKLLDFYKKIL